MEVSEGWEVVGGWSYDLPMLISPPKKLLFILFIIICIYLTVMYSRGDLLAGGMGNRGWAFGV